MIWKRADPKAALGHQEARIAELEADFLALSQDLLDYFGEVMPPGDHLAKTLRAIIKKREDASTKK